MDGRVRAVALDEAEERAGVAVDDRERLARRPSAARRGRRGSRVPSRRSRPTCARARGARRARGALRCRASRRRSSYERRLERRREDVRVEDARVGVVEDRRLDPPREERLRLAREELVERVVARDEDREPPVAPARAPPLLAERRDGSREADGDRAVEEADVDPELERVGRGDAEQLALDQAPLDLAALLGRVAGAVGREPRCGRGVDALGGEAVDQLGRLAALREADRPQASRRELREQAGGVAERARAQAELGVEERRVPDDDLALGSRGRVAVDDRRRLAGQLERELAGVGDRRRGEQELRLGVVDPREPPQPPQDVRRRASRRRRGTRAPRRRRRSGGSRARRPSGRGGEGRRRGACPGS